MSFGDRLLLWLHIGFAIFTIGPLTAVTSATPRYIRNRDLPVVRYLHRATRVFGLAALGVFIFGLWLAIGELDEIYLSASMTLFAVTLVLLFLVERDQRRAAQTLDSEDPRDDDLNVLERRIAMISGVVALSWLVILVLMIWGDPR